MTKLAIIGGGWLGCHLALSLSSIADVVLYERNDSLISGTSFINQNRLHYGYHYARNAITRNLCRETFYKFIAQYPEVVRDVLQNYYAVSDHESLLDAGTISLIFDKWEHRHIDNIPFAHTSLLIDTVEKRIDAFAAGCLFEAALDGIFRREEIDFNGLACLQKDYDYVIDCTNNSLLEPADNHFFEKVVMFLYRPIKKLPFGALTYIDGNLFSIYPYDDNSFSLSHVKHGIISSGQRLPATENVDLDEKRMAMEEHVMHYWPDFANSLEYSSPAISIKAKIKDNSANRAPLFRRKDNILSFFTGKIQGIYAAESIVKQIIAQP